jgi:hypothetical protein
MWRTTAASARIACLACRRRNPGHAHAWSDPVATGAERAASCLRARRLSTADLSPPTIAARVPPPWWASDLDSGRWQPDARVTYSRAHKRDGAQASTSIRIRRDTSPAGHVEQGALMKRLWPAIPAPVLLAVTALVADAQPLDTAAAGAPGVLGPYAVAQFPDGLPVHGVGGDSSLMFLAQPTASPSRPPDVHIVHRLTGRILGESRHLQAGGAHAYIHCCQCRRDDGTDSPRSIRAVGCWRAAMTGGSSGYQSSRVLVLVLVHVRRRILECPSGQPPTTRPCGATAQPTRWSGLCWSRRLAVLG